MIHGAGQVNLDNVDPGITTINGLLSRANIYIYIIYIYIYIFRFQWN